ncbi:hypothetical protein [Paraburkholderia dipogonis]|uniref:hypothetical protein n=1 Tax=Paraburkholderia dipogonis TaxID=1211383 RepID=UPI0038BC0ACC
MNQGSGGKQGGGGHQGGGAPSLSSLQSSFSVRPTQTTQQTQQQTHQPPQQYGMQQHVGHPPMTFGTGSHIQNPQQGHQQSMQGFGPRAPQPSMQSLGQQAPQHSTQTFGQQAPQQPTQSFGPRAPQPSIQSFGQQTPQQSMQNFGQQAPQQSMQSFGQQGPRQSGIIRPTPIRPLNLSPLLGTTVSHTNLASTTTTSMMTGVQPSSSSVSNGSSGRERAQSPGGRTYERNPTPPPSGRKPYSRRDAAGYKNPSHDHPNMLPHWESAAASPIPHSMKSSRKARINHLMRPERRFHTKTPSGQSTGIIKGHGKGVLGHHPDASSDWNSGGHRRTRSQNSAHNRQTGTYHGIEDRDYSNASGSSAPAYVAPRPDIGSHPSHWNSTHPDFTGNVPWPTWSPVQSTQSGSGGTGQPPQMQTQTTSMPSSSQGYSGYGSMQPVQTPYRPQNGTQTQMTRPQPSLSSMNTSGSMYSSGYSQQFAPTQLYGGMGQSGYALPQPQSHQLSLMPQHGGMWQSGLSLPPPQSQQLAPMHSHGGTGPGGFSLPQPQSHQPSSMPPARRDGAERIFVATAAATTDANAIVWHRESGRASAAVIAAATTACAIVRKPVAKPSRRQHLSGSGKPGFKKFVRPRFACQSVSLRERAAPGKRVKPAHGRVTPIAGKRVRYPHI